MKGTKATPVVEYADGMLKSILSITNHHHENTKETSFGRAVFTRPIRFQKLKESLYSKAHKGSVLS